MSGEPFVGRGAELSRLRGLLDALVAGAGGVVLVEGEQGIGKSALLREGLAGAAGAGCRVLWGTANELGQRVPLELMADCLGSEASSWDLIRDGGGVLAGDPVLAGIERVLVRVDRLCAVSSVVLVAEDLQRADEASLLAWQRLSRAVDQLPLLLAGSCRRETGSDGLARLRQAVTAAGGVIIGLDVLSDAEVGELVGRIAGGQPGQRLAEVTGRAGGNPLYARELTDALAREGRVAVGGGVAELAGSAPVRVPVSLAAAIAERLRWLAKDVVHALRWAAVLGPEFSVGDLQLVTGRSASDLIGVVDAAMDTGVVAEAGQRLAFRHGLIRQALYEAIPESLRVALHLQAARALADFGVAPERVAGHMIAAGQMAEGWLLDWLAGAAPNLVYRVPQIAADLVTGVLGQLADDDPRREALEASLVRAAYLLLRDEEVERAGRQLIAKTSDPDLAAEIAWLVVSTLRRTGQTAQAVTEAASALARPDVSQTHAARLQSVQATALIALGQLDHAAQLAEPALAAAEQTGDPVAIGYSCMALESISYFRRDYAVSLAYIDRGLSAVGYQPEVADVRLRLLANRAGTLSTLDRLEESITSFGRALELAESAGIPQLNLIRTGLAGSYFDAGRWDDALAELEQAVGPTDAFDRNSTSQQLVDHGLSALIAGHRDERNSAEEHLAAVQDLALDDDLPLWANAWALIIARALAAEQAGRLDTAVAALAQYLCHPVAKLAPGRVLVMPTLTRLAVAVGDTATSDAAARAMAEAAQADQLAGSAAWADHCRGLATGDPAPILAAAAYFERTGRPLDRGHALEDAAVLAGAQGDGSAARQALAGAVSVYQGLGARWDMTRASARLKAYGIRPRRASVARPAKGWGALTPTEVKVACLVADGRSNSDVAQELFLSRNTVQTHVSHILAKLQVRSRAEIVREALIDPGQH